MCLCNPEGKEPQTEKKKLPKDDRDHFAIKISLAAVLKLLDKYGEDFWNVIQEAVNRTNRIKFLASKLITIHGKRTPGYSQSCHSCSHASFSPA